MEEKNDNKRQRIINAAAEAFAANPFHKVLLSEIAKAAHVGKGTLYLYFKNKEELFFAILYQGFSEIVEDLTTLNIDDNEPANQTLERMLRAIFKRVQETTINNMQLLRGTIIGYPESACWTSKTQEIHYILEKLIERGIEQKIFTNIQPNLAPSYLFALIRAAFKNINHGMEQQLVMEQTITFALQGLGVL